MRNRIYIIRKWSKVGVIGSVFLFATTTLVFAQTPEDLPTQVQNTPFSIGKIFTFVFMTLGPLKIIGPFVEMTRGQDKVFKRKLALRSSIIAAIAMIVAATAGSKTLIAWGISIGSLSLAAGIILFLVALTPVLAQYKPKEAGSLTPEPDNTTRSVSSLAFSPLAFPTIVTPYGIALLILLVTLRSDHLPEIIGIMAVILVLNLLAMLFGEYMLKSSLVAALLGIIGTVIGVLQVALGVQVVLDALRQLGVL